MVLFGPKVVVFEQKWLFLGIFFLFEKLVVFGQKWFYLGKIGCI